MTRPDPSTLMTLLPRAYGPTTEVLTAIPAEQLDAPTPCADWSLRKVGNHLLGTLDLFARIGAGQVIDPAEFQGAGPERDFLGSDPGAAYRSAADRCTTAFARPGVLEQVFDFVFGPTPGHVIATISLSESLLHGWDLARGAGLPYTPDDSVVAVVAEFQGDGEQQREMGMYGPAQPIAPGATPFATLLAVTGRRS